MHSAILILLRGSKRGRIAQAHQGSSQAKRQRRGQENHNHDFPGKPCFDWDKEAIVVSGD